jgi:predicted DNA-binding transcriptional regulator YafY
VRADRLLSILLLLQVHRRMTAHALARQLEVSERTIYRDADALSAAGVPVVATRGHGGGLSLIDGFRTNLTGLTEEEAQTLVVSRPQRLLAELGMDHSSSSALTKLHAALPGPARIAARQIGERIHVDESGWLGTRDDVPLLPTLLEAIWEERALAMTYTRGESAFERLVEPLGLVAKGSAWYLVARAEGELRSYRVSRIRAARVTDTPFTRPPDFDLASFWEQSSAEFVAAVPRYYVTVRAHPEIVPIMPHVGKFTRIERMDPPGEDGWTVVCIRFQLEWEARHYVLGFADRIEVIDPVELRQALSELARAVGLR